MSKEILKFLADHDLPSALESEIYTVNEADKKVCLSKGVGSFFISYPKAVEELRKIYRRKDLKSIQEKLF